MRAANTDVLQGFRYHVIAEDNSGRDLLQPKYSDDRTGYEGGGQAGFQSVTLPELSIEAAEYREGNFKWAQKLPGPPTVSDVTCMRGVTKRDTAFYDMAMASVDGDEYRVMITIYHYQRAEMADALKSEGNDTHRRIECGECFATRVKTEGDLDATAGDVSLAEVDIAVEHFTPKYE